MFTTLNNDSVCQKISHIALKKDADKLKSLLDEYEEIFSKLEAELVEDNMPEYYTDMMALTRKIVNHIVKSQAVKERLGDIMGGKVLELQSEKDRRIGKEEGREEEREYAISVIQTLSGMSYEEASLYYDKSRNSKRKVYV